MNRNELGKRERDGTRLAHVFRDAYSRFTYDAHDTPFILIHECSTKIKDASCIKRYAPSKSSRIRAMTARLFSQHL